MAKFKGFGVPPAQKPEGSVSSRSTTSTDHPTPSLDLKTKAEMWNAGLLILELPNQIQPRPLTQQETEWLYQAAQTEYIDPEVNGLNAIFYTAPPPDFDLQRADWYLRPSWYWNRSPIALVEIMQQYPIELFQLTASGQPPAFYPDPHSGCTTQQEQDMRQIFRETVRLGWSLPDYKWYVMQQFQKTTATVTQFEAQQILSDLQQCDSEN
ncbi:MAG: hypothetical protein MUC48_03825 [Leptolyngbya sp. Prado105]|jgi:hypothetical protein|nr:hypothetical protein [Leptolyngbya sp. Prado105]